MPEASLQDVLGLRDKIHRNLFVVPKMFDIFGLKSFARCPTLSIQFLGDGNADAGADNIASPLVHILDSGNWHK